MNSHIKLLLIFVIIVLIVNILILNMLIDNENHGQNYADSRYNFDRDCFVSDIFIIFVDTLNLI